MNFTDRLNAILPRITEDGFLQKKGLGNEIPFMFCYPPEEELKVREHIGFIIERLSQQHAHVRVLHLRLFDLMIQHLRERAIWIRRFVLESGIKGHYGTLYRHP